MVLSMKIKDCNQLYYIQNQIYLDIVDLINDKLDIIQQQEFLFIIRKAFYGNELLTALRNIKYQKIKNNN